jgi:ABC-type sulfate transport system permease subunit
VTWIASWTSSAGGTSRENFARSGLAFCVAELYFCLPFLSLPDLGVLPSKFLPDDSDVALAWAKVRRLGKLRDRHRSGGARLACHVDDFVAVTTPIEVLLGLAMALFLNESFRGRGWLRAVVTGALGDPTVVSSQMWRFLFNDRYGLFNFVLFGDATDRYWAPLAEPGLALASIMVADIWKTSSFAALIILAGLQGIPHELYEAASIDGASAWQKFRHITLPLIKPALLWRCCFASTPSSI